MPFDFLLEYYKIIIELDGRQHFENFLKRHDYKLTQQRDKYKMECANAKGYSVIRILQEDVLFDKNNWQNNLQLAVVMVKNIDKVSNILIGDTYLKHPIYKVNDVVYL